MAIVRQSVPDLVCILPAVPHLSAIVRELTRNWPVPLHIVSDEADKFAAFGTVNAALAASGTVTTELALAGVPMAVAYKLGWLTATLMRPLIRVPFVTLVNLLLEREAVPEFLQERCRAGLLAPCAVRLLTDPVYRGKQKRDLREAVHQLGLDEEQPSLRAARALLEFVQERRAAESQRLSSGV
jgi:lipid-A-disaccharide synthase